MKYLFCLIVLLNFKSFAQAFTVQEIKTKANPKFLYIDTITIFYPLIKTGNPAIDKQINKAILEDTFDEEYENMEIRKAVKKMTDDGLINLTYEITYRRNNILSMTISGEGCGAYCYTWDTYLNFDLKTGKRITVEQLFDADKIDSLWGIVYSDKKKFLAEYKKDQLNALSQGKIDSTTYAFSIEEVDSSCILDDDFAKFSLSKGDIEFIGQCDFPKVMESQEPILSLKYSYKSLEFFLKPQFKSRLLN